MFKKLKDIFNRQRPPRKLRTITFKDRNTSNIYGYCQRQYRFTALGDTWMTAKRQKDNGYNIYIHSYYLSAKSKMIAAGQSYEATQQIMGDFEQGLSRHSDFGPGVLQHHRKKTAKHFTRVTRPSYGN